MSLLDLPDDWLFMIVEFCPEKIWTLRRVCRRFQTLISSRICFTKKVSQTRLCGCSDILLFQNISLPEKALAIWQSFHVGFNKNKIRGKYDNYMMRDLGDSFTIAQINFDSNGDVKYPFYAIRVGHAIMFGQKPELKIKYLIYLGCGQSKTFENIDEHEYRAHYKPELWKEYQKTFAIDNNSKQISTFFEEFCGR